MQLKAIYRNTERGHDDLPLGRSVGLVGSHFFVERFLVGSHRTGFLAAGFDWLEIFTFTDEGLTRVGCSWVRACFRLLSLVKPTAELPFEPGRRWTKNHSSALALKHGINTSTSFGHVSGFGLRFGRIRLRYAVVSTSNDEEKDPYFLPS